MTDHPDGQYGFIDDETYHGNTGRLSSTGARLLLPPSVPALFKYRQDNPQPPKRAYDIGHVAHRLVLGKGAEIMVLHPSTNGLKKDGTASANPRATETWKQAEADARRAGQVPIHVDDYQAAKRMAEAIHAHPDAAAILADGQAEMSLYATDPVTGVKLRARPDWMTVDMADVKTAVTAEPGAFARQGAKLGYHIQDAFYRLVAKLLGIDVDRFVFIVVEKTEPHLVNVVEYDAEASAEGDRLVRQAIDTFARCRDANTWPGYGGGIQTISLPMWLLDDEMDIA